jgi:predicted nucleotidyltransferase
MAEGQELGLEDTFGLGSAALESIRAVFARHPEVRMAKIFGSRATGRFEKGSDVDLVLWGDVDASLLAHILAELDELPLPYTFDVKDYETISHEPLRRAIDETARVLYEN